LLHEIYNKYFISFQTLIFNNKYINIENERMISYRTSFLPETTDEAMHIIKNVKKRGLMRAAILFRKVDKEYVVIGYLIRLGLLCYVIILTFM
jgi:hypothetical protein